MHKFQSNGGIRSMAIRHFGELVRDMSQYRWMLTNAVFRALVPLILFLEDTETRVTTVSPAILLFLVWQRCAVFYMTPDKETLTDCFLLRQACKHTLAICVSELCWPTEHLLLDRCYSFELVVLSICNNLVSGPLGFPTKRYRKNIKGPPERWEGWWEQGESWRRKVKIIIINKWV